MNSLYWSNSTPSQEHGCSSLANNSVIASYNSSSALLTVSATIPRLDLSISLVGILTSVVAIFSFFGRRLKPRAAVSNVVPKLVASSAACLATVFTWAVQGCQDGGPAVVNRPMATGEALITPIPRSFSNEKHKINEVLFHYSNAITVTICVSVIIVSESNLALF